MKTFPLMSQNICQNSILTTIKRKLDSCCSTNKDLPIDVSLTTEGLILTKLG